MPTCPRCRAGQKDKPPIARGVLVLTDTRKRRLYSKRCPLGRLTFQRAVLCRDCGHSWWTTRFDSTLKLQAMLDREKQLRLPGAGPVEPALL